MNASSANTNTNINTNSIAKVAATLMAVVLAATASSASGYAITAAPAHPATAVRVPLQQPATILAVPQAPSNERSSGPRHEYQHAHQQQHEYQHQQYQQQSPDAEDDQEDSFMVLPSSPSSLSSHHYDMGVGKNRPFTGRVSAPQPGYGSSSASASQPRTPTMTTSSSAISATSASARIAAMIASSSNRNGDGTSIAADAMVDAARYWVDYESTRPYPSPVSRVRSSQHSQSQSQSTTDSKMDSKTESSPAQQPNKGKAKKNLPKIKLQRRSEDVLSIVSDPTQQQLQSQHHHQPQHTARPTMIATPTMINESSNNMNGDMGSRRQQMDLNTVWVEMLIHSEQQSPLSSLSPAHAAMVL